MHGHLSVAVPGSVAGLALALERWGTWDLRDAVAPAARLARRGVPGRLVPRRRHGDVRGGARAIPRGGADISPRRPVAPAAGAPRGRRSGPLPGLARSLELIGKEGASVFYRGEIGEAIEAEIRRGGGILDRTDLGRYRVRVSAPLAGDYRGVTLLGMPGATGCVTALEMLNVLECFEPGAQGPTGAARRAPPRRGARGSPSRTASAGSGIPRGSARRGPRSPGRPMPARWPRGSAPMAAATRGGASIRGASSAAARGPTGTPAAGPDRRVHDARVRGRRRPHPGVADPHGGQPLRLQGRRAGDGAAALERDDLVRSGAWPAELHRAGQAPPGQHDALPRAPGRHAVPGGGRAGRPQDRVRRPPGALEPDRLRAGPPGGGRSAAASHRGRCGPGRRSLGGGDHRPSSGGAAIRVVPLTETYSSFYFARPQAIEVTRRRAEGAGVDHLRPATAMGI